MKYLVLLIDANENEIDCGVAPNKGEAAHIIQEVLDRYHYQPKEMRFIDLPDGSIRVEVGSETEHFILRPVLTEQTN